ncbi:uncharacterized protein LOC128550363 [Mercenaria mercenaria]|uniref:uncharacterized protein LOC128550363 n=1 Tax=Mercenaria mercenaria TaxID=6596 RepID=UPI00234F8848|nr:uncharacterized protein LOC128550363 [Mercenaria mercenaria]
MATICQREKHLDFTTFAEKIDSKIDPDFVSLLKNIEIWNIIHSCELFANEELIPVGSCVDGSKVTVPGDCGDMDVLIVSNNIILKEYLFDYDQAFPAFLHIRVNNEHQKYFQIVKDPIEGVYLPAAALKERLEELPFISKLLMKYETLNFMSEDSKFLNVNRSTAVGKEQMQLYPVEQNAFKSNNKPNTLKLNLTGMENFAKYALGGIMNLTKQTEKRTHAKDGSTICETNNRTMLTDHDNTSLLEMLNRFNDMSKGKATDSGKTKNIQHTSGERPTEAADDGKGISMQRETYLEKEDNNMPQDSFSTDTLRVNAYERKLSRDCPATKTKWNDFGTDSKLDNKRKNKNVMKSNPTEAKESCSARERIKKSSKHETKKRDASFSKLKSIDFVPAFKFEGWPRVADEWVTRSRKWPSKVTLKRVLESGCQVVAKQPLALYSKPIAEERDPYFRLSFALSEIILAQSLKEQQLLCWRVLKAYQKRFLETSPKCLTSYHWKNVMFWVNETLDESFWTDENVPVAVNSCLDFMTDCLQKRNLPFYFVRRMNLLNGCDEALFDTLREQVELIRREPLEFLKKFLVEPSCSETHFIDKCVIKNILSEEEQAKNIKRKSKEMVNCAMDLPYFVKNQYPIHKVITHLLKRCRSEVDERLSYNYEDTENSQEKLFLDTIDTIEHTMESMKNNGREAVFIGVSDLFETVAKLINDEVFNNKNGTDSEIARNQRFSNVFSSLSSFVKRPQEDDRSSGDISNFLSTCHEFAVSMQEQSNSVHTESNESEGKESKEANAIFSVFNSTFAELVEVWQKHEDKKEINPADEIRKVLHEASQKIETVFRREDKAKRKPDMDIDLD